MIAQTGGEEEASAATREDEQPAAGEAQAREDAEGEDAEGEQRQEPEPGEAGAPPSGVEVIRVVGEIMGDIQTDVSQSVTLFDAEELKALGAQNVADLAKATPNLEIKTAGATAPTFFIRGVGLSDFAANAPGAVAVYQDDVPVNAPALQLGTIFDLESVAVERGPQGSGSGRNASAGAIRLISRRPTGELDAFLRSSIGNYFLRDFEGAIEVPLAEDVLSSRFAFRWTERDPIANNRCSHVPSEAPAAGLPPPPAFVGQRVPPLSERIANPAPWRNVSLCGESRYARFANMSPPPYETIQFFPGGGISALPGGLEGDVNDKGNWAARGQLRFQPPGTDMEWLFNAHGSRTDQLSTLGQAIGTAPPPGNFGNTTVQGYIDRNVAHMRERIQAKLAAGGLSGPELTEATNEKLARELARNLDSHPFSGDYNRVGDTTLDTWGAFARGDWMLGPVTLTSISGYDAYDRFRDTDQDFTPDILFEAAIDDHAWQLTQELKASGELPDATFRWNLGGFYLMENLENDMDQLARITTSAFPARLLQDYEQDLWSWGAFSGFEWDFLDDFRLEGGVRWNWERKDFEKTLDFYSNIAFENLRVGPRETPSETWQAPTGALTLSYQFVEDASVYWSYSRGWKGGHFSAIPQLNRGTSEAEPEQIDAFEVGVKGNWFDGRLGLGLELFYYQYADYQVFIVEDSPAGPPAIAIINANDAENYGADLDLRIEPFESLVVTGRLGWLESRFLDFTNQVVRSFIGENQSIRNVTVTVDYTGNRLINSPRLKASGSVEYTLELGRYGALLPRYDFAWTDDIYFDPTEGHGSPNLLNEVFLPDYAVGQRAYWIHNARLGYRTPDGNIEIAGWVRNFMDEVYKTTAFDASTFSGVVVNYVGEPRTYGLELSINF